MLQGSDKGFAQVTRIPLGHLLGFRGEKKSRALERTRKGREEAREGGRGLTNDDGDKSGQLLCRLHLSWLVLGTADKQRVHASERKESTGPKSKVIWQTIVLAAIRAIVGRLRPNKNFQSGPVKQSSAVAERNEGSPQNG